MPANNLLDPADFQRRFDAPHDLASREFDFIVVLFHNETHTQTYATIKYIHMIHMMHRSELGLLVALLHESSVKALTFRCCCWRQAEKHRTYP